jgi:hypothetical protein
MLNAKGKKGLTKNFVVKNIDNRYYRIVYDTQINKGIKIRIRNPWSAHFKTA